MSRNVFNLWLKGMLFVFFVLIITHFLFGCATFTNLFKQTPKTFTIEMESGNMVVNMPLDFPKNMENIPITLHQCWNAHLCVIIYDFNLEKEPQTNWVNFWYSGDYVFGIVYTTKEAEKNRFWLMHEGKPMPCTIDEIQAVIDALYFEQILPDDSI